MHPVFVPRSEAAAPIPIWFVTAATEDAVRRKLDAPARAFASAAAFEAKAGRHLLLPGPDGVAGVLFGLDAPDKPGRDLFLPGRLPGLLPPGTYRFANAPDDPRLAALRPPR